MGKPKFNINFTLEENNVKVDVDLPNVKQEDTVMVGRKISTILNMLFNGILNDHIKSAIGASKEAGLANFVLRNVESKNMFSPVILPTKCFSDND